MGRVILRKLRNYFLAGLAVIVPIALTMFIIWTMFRKLDGLLQGVVNKVLVNWLGLTQIQGPIPGLGFITLIILIIITGMIARNYAGRKIIQVGDSIVARIPLISKIYIAIQQIMQALFSEKSEVFKKAVLIEYPRRGIYSVGFFTQDTKGVIQESIEEDVISVFLPTTPNPTSGFLLFVPKEEVIELDLSVEEALKLVVSGGAVIAKGKKHKITPVSKELLLDEQKA